MLRILPGGSVRRGAGLRRGCGVRGVCWVCTMTGAEVQAAVSQLAGGVVRLPVWWRGSWDDAAERIAAGGSVEVVVTETDGWRHLRACLECGDLMLSVRPQARTCSVRCRVRRHRRL